MSPEHTNIISALQPADVPQQDNRIPLVVLLVEDDPADAKIMRRFLEKSRFFNMSVTHASDMPSARGELSNAHFDVLILDYWMRAEPSLSVLGNDGDLICDVPAVVVSSVDVADVQAIGLQAGALGYLHKNDLSSSTMDAVLRTLLHTRLKEMRLKQSLITSERDERELRGQVEEMAHEVLSTLNAVHGFAELMEVGGKAADMRIDTTRYPQLIKQGSERVIALVQRYLANIDTENFCAELIYEQIDVTDVARAAFQTMQGQCQKRGQNLELITEPGELMAEVDSTAMYQMLVNLIGNASKYSAEHSPIRVALVDLGPDIKVQVIDQGIGMTEIEVGVALRRYARVMAPSELVATGHGLGMTIVTSIVDLHSGSIAIESAKGWGTTVTVTLPKVRPEFN